MTGSRDERIMETLIHYSTCTVCCKFQLLSCSSSLLVESKFRMWTRSTLFHLWKCSNFFREASCFAVNKFQGVLFHLKINFGDINFGGSILTMTLSHIAPSNIRNRYNLKAKIVKYIYIPHLPTSLIFIHVIGMEPGEYASYHGPSTPWKSCSVHGTLAGLCLHRLWGYRDQGDL